MEKFFLHSVALIASLLFSLNASAYVFSAENADGVTLYYDVISNAKKTCQIVFRETNHNSYSGDIVIPETVVYDNQQYTVTKIGPYAFYDCPNLTSVSIPNTITEIGCNALGACPQITSIVIPDGVEAIEDEMFINDKALVSIHLPENLKTIGRKVFWGCSGLTSLDIPNSVYSIGDAAFWSCTGFRYFTLPESLTAIPMMLFDDCRNLVSVNIPEGVTTIEQKAFYNCCALTSIRLSKRLSMIASGAFNYCENLATVYNASQLDVVAGSATHGGVAYYATDVIDVRDEYNIYNGNAEAVLSKNIDDVPSIATCPNALVFTNDVYSNLPANFVVNGSAKSVILTDALPFYCPM